MKKRLIILTAFCYLAFINTSAQEAIEAGSEKKNYTSLVKIKTNTGETIEAALSRRTPDTVYILQLEDKYVKAGGKQIKILKENAETGIAIDQISNYEVNNDTNIIYADDLNKRKKQLKSKKTWKIVGTVTLVVVALPIVAVCAVAGSF
jgi:hypothetical protein